MAHADQLDRVRLDEVQPLDAELEHLSGKFKYFLSVTLRWLIHQRDQGVEVNVQLAADELSALIRILEALEVRLDHSLHPIEEHHLVRVVEVEVAKRHLALACVALRVFSEWRDARRRRAHCLIVPLRPAVKMNVNAIVSDIVVNDACDAPVVHRVLGVDVHVQQVQRFGREEGAGGRLLLLWIAFLVQNLRTVALRRLLGLLVRCLLRALL